MSDRNKPNVIFLMCDELRADSLGFSGNPVVKTPNLDTLATDAVVFENAYCTSPMCCPSRASLATGRYPLSHGVLDNGCLIMEDEQSLYESFRRSGYRTVNVGKWHVNARDAFGMDRNLDHFDCPDQQATCFGIADPELRKQAAYTKIPGAISLVIHGRRPFPADETVDSGFTRAFVTEIERAHEDRKPAFLRLSLYDPHSPYMPASPYDSMYDPDCLQLPKSFRASLDGKPVLQRLFHDARGFDRLTELDYRKCLASYYGLISHVDDRLGTVIARLKSLGLYDDSIIVFCSDHGSMMGEHGYIEKWGHMYDPVARIPLAVKLPRGDALPRKSDAFVENLDIIPTLLDYLGISIPSQVQGKSFLSVLRGEQSEHRKTIHSSVFAGGFQAEPALMVRDERWKYSRYPGSDIVERGLALDHPLRFSDCFDGDPVGGELYDLASDPSEEHNLFGDPDFAETQQYYDSLVSEWVGSLGAIADYRTLSGSDNQAAFFRLAQSDSVKKVNVALTKGSCEGRFEPL